MRPITICGCLIIFGTLCKYNTTKMSYHITPHFAKNKAKQNKRSKSFREIYDFLLDDGNGAIWFELL